MFFGMIFSVAFRFVFVLKHSKKDLVCVLIRLGVCARAWDSSLRVILLTDN